MGLKRTDEFRQDAVRIALTSGLTRKQVADDLGVGMSTLNIEHVPRHWFERACERSRRIETRMWCQKRI
jgi:transposase